MPAHSGYDWAMKTVREEIQDWFAIIDDYLKSAEGNLQNEKFEAAESDVFQARLHLLQARDQVAKIQN